MYKFQQNILLFIFAALIFLPGAYKSWHIFYSSHNHTTHDCCDHDYPSDSEHNFAKKGESCYVINFEFCTKHQNPNLFYLSEDLFFFAQIAIDHTSNYRYSYQISLSSRAPPMFS